MFGQADTDDLTGRGGDDLLSGGDNDFRPGAIFRGADGLYGGGGDDELRGGDGGDRLKGSRGADVVSGDDGDDLIIPGNDGEVDDYSGGAGEDEIGYFFAGSGYVLTDISVSLDGAANDGAGCPAKCEGEDIPGDIESISGNSGDDHLTGNGGRT